MLVRLLFAIQGPGGSHDRGAIVDLPAERARELIEAGRAEQVPLRLRVRPKPVGIMTREVS